MFLHAKKRRETNPRKKPASLSASELKAATSSQDTFLPVPSSAVIKSSSYGYALTGEEDFLSLTLSDTEPEDLASECCSVDNDNDSDS